MNPVGSDGKESACKAEPRFNLWVRKGYPLQYSCLENSRERTLVGYNPWGHKESDTTELTLSFLMNFQESEVGNYYVEIHRKANTPLPIKAKTKFVCRSLNETEIRKYVNLCHLRVYHCKSLL